MDDAAIKKEVMSHVDSDVEYPATKDDLVKACDNMSDVSEGAKKWFMEKLPEGTYANAGAVKQALGAI